MGVLMTSVFLVGSMAGSGILALPSAVESTGWVGLVVLVLCGMGASYTGEVLGECWDMVQERFPAMRGPVRYPYPAIGMLTFGRAGRYDTDTYETTSSRYDTDTYETTSSRYDTDTYETTSSRVIVSVAVDFSMLGGAVVFLLLAGQNVAGVVRENGGPSLPLCYWFIVISVLLFPLTLRASPKEFHWIGVGAMGATVIACIILLVVMAMDARAAQPVHHREIRPLPFAAALGTFMFAYGGHPVFPTFQTDMKAPRKFGISCRIAFFCLLCIFLPVAAVGYFVYGSRVKANILQTVTPGPALQVVECLITAHLVCSFVIVINPVCQELEEIIGISPHFNVKRVLMRLGVCLGVLMVAETLPHFGAVMSLIGGSSMTLLVFICPPIFFFRLALAKGPWPLVVIPVCKTVLLIVIMVLGIVLGVAATISAITVLSAPGTFIPPCFINVTAAGR
ncbi:uncharacterized protein LOC143291966 [Babylonia areolata]|uniref:uncharacterized protein LOC143291966 n=1 Tax=Babylonia areolata TaxID=304850 RepID=UPI003FD4E281